MLETIPNQWLLRSLYDVLIFYVDVIILVNGSINGNTWIPNMLEPRWI